MSDELNLEAAINAIYASLTNDNHEIDENIKNLKTAMQISDLKEVTLEAAKLAQNNRQGRKLLQSYFKKRGVKVAFS